ncbi:DUF4433 domain-containing protein [Microbispora bryophytorum]|uniref:DUF4433 domain-containing protein n=1 Tax=Microbispora bryophytorum TaxID=1460882 RepID=UPI003410B957
MASTEQRMVSMDRDRVAELHYIAPIANLTSIAFRGILCHNLAKTVDHVSVALESVQDIRRGKRLPNGELLHDYTNLYFDARNPMMYLRKSEREDLVVIRVNPAVLDLPGAIVSDGNAATSGTQFYWSPAGLRMLDEERVYAEWWTDPDRWVWMEKKRQRCAEVLIPGSVAPQYLMGCYVYSRAAEQVCQSHMPDLGVVVKADVFFG